MTYNLLSNEIIKVSNLILNAAGWRSTEGQRQGGASDVYIFLAVVFVVWLSSGLALKAFHRFRRREVLHQKQNLVFDPTIAPDTDLLMDFWLLSEAGEHHDYSPDLREVTYRERIQTQSETPSEGKVLPTLQYGYLLAKDDEWEEGVGFEDIRVNREQRHVQRSVRLAPEIFDRLFRAWFTKWLFSGNIAFEWEKGARSERFSVKLITPSGILSDEELGLYNYLHQLIGDNPTPIGELSGEINKSSTTLWDYIVALKEKQSQRAVANGFMSGDNRHEIFASRYEEKGRARLRELFTLRRFLADYLMNAGNENVWTKYISVGALLGDNEFNRFDFTTGFKGAESERELLALSLGATRHMAHVLNLYVIAERAAHMPGSAGEAQLFANAK